MITISDRVAGWIVGHPYHADFIAAGLVNSSALARFIRPELEREAGEKLSLEAIVLAINRYTQKTSKHTLPDFDQFIGEVSVQTGLSILTLPQVNLNTTAFLQAIQELHKNQEYTLYTRGVWHTSLIGKAAVIKRLSQRFKGGIITHDLVGLTVKLRPGHLPTPGVCGYVLQKVAFASVNLIEVASSHDELTLIVGQSAATTALATLV